MTDRPIIFSAPMVRALLAGRKTQTRRLATSPLRRCEVGDRLYVREAFRVGYAANWYREDLGRCPKPKEMDPATTGIEFIADGEHELGGKGYPSMHMPRWASRPTLIVEAVKVEPLQAISEADAQSEGVVWSEPTDADREWARAYAEENGGDGNIHGVWTVSGVPAQKGLRSDVWHVSLGLCFGRLWDSLHTKEGERWQDNPEVVALTFRVERGNIDRIAS